MSASIRLLVLEDNALDAELMLGLLDAGGLPAQAVRVETREAFEQALTQDSFDLILADYSLPSFDGLIALKLARERQPQIPVLLVSGVLGEDLAIEALTQGATDYVLKQRLSRLAPAVRRALEEARAQREREEARAARDRGEALLRAIIEGTTDAVFVKDRDGRYLMINAAGARFCGKSIAEIIGTDDSTLFDAETAQRLREADRRVMESDTTETFEETARSWGRLRTFLVTKGPLHDASGQVIGVFGISRDITARKSEEERLREAETKYRLIIEQLPVVTYVGSIEQAYLTLRVSPRLAATLGFSEEDLDDPELWLQQLHPEDRARVLADYERTSRDGEPTASEYRFYAADGTVHRFLDRRSLHREGGYVQGVMLLLAPPANGSQSG